MEDVHLIYLTIRNSGNIEILPSDFHDPINFDFGAKAKVLEVVLLEAKPKNIQEKISFSIETNTIKLMPLLLNRGDLIKFKVLVTKFSGTMSDIKVNARIAGIPQIYRSTENEPYVAVVGSAFVKMVLTLIGSLAGVALFFLLLALFFHLVGITFFEYLYYELSILPLVFFPSFTVYSSIKQKISKRTLSLKEKTLFYIPPLALAVVIFVVLNLLVILSKRPIHLLPPY